jgi:hypothetical protein
MINSDRVHINLDVPESTLLSFRAKIRLDLISGCWNWQGNLTSGGYGSVGRVKVSGGRNIRAHQLSWIIYNGEIPRGLWVCHKCDNPSCVNPEHLFLGTPKDNAQDKITKGRANHPIGVKTGHAQLDENKVRKIIDMLASGKSSMEVRKELNLPIRARTIRQILSGQTWKHVTRPDSFVPKKRVNQYG